MSGCYSAQDVTVVIPARDAAATLAATLAALKAQLAGEPRIVVVDDGSLDQTAAVARAAGVHQLIPGQGRGPAAARNLGIAATATPLIAFCDADDLWPAQRLVEDLAAFTQDPSLEILLGRSRFEADDPALMVGLRFPEEEPIVLIPHFGAATMRTHVFTRLGSIDETLLHYEDYEWFFRARDGGAVITSHARVAQIHRLRHGSLSRIHRPRPADLIAILHRSLRQRRAARVVCETPD